MGHRAEIRPAVGRGNIKEYFSGDPALKGYWPFDNNAQDWSGNNNHGTVTAATLYKGKFGNCYKFDGSSTSINCGTGINPGGLTEFTIGAWVKSTAGAINAAIGGWWDGSDGIFLQSAYLPEGDGFLFLVGQTGHWAQVLTKTSNDWVFVAGVYNGTGSTNIAKLKIYVNGAVQVLTFQGGTIPTSIYPISATLKIGDVGTINRKWDGLIEKFFVFSRALSSAEISQYYQWAITKPKRYWLYNPTTVASTGGKPLLDGFASPLLTGVLLR